VNWKKGGKGKCEREIGRGKTMAIEGKVRVSPITSIPYFPPTSTKMNLFCREMRQE